MKDLLIVKVGTNVPAKTNNQICQLDDESFKNIGAQIRQLSYNGIKIILVSSGAITAGIANDNLCREDINDTAELQRFSARGWHTIIQKWSAAIGAEKVSASLLTKHEIHTAATRQKMLDFMTCCFAHGDIVLVNENDAICDDKIKFGDNDMLAAALATELSESKLSRRIRLVLLTNKNGLNKIENDDTTLIRKVINIAKVERYACQSNNCNSRGGMVSKIQAARLATTTSVETFIANGRMEHAIVRALNGEIGTHFIAQS